MATLITKNSSTASSVPTAAQLVQGELAVNVTDKRLFTENASGTVVELGTNPSSLTLPNGVANAVCYLNGSKVLTTGSALTFDGTNLQLGMTNGSFSGTRQYINNATLSGTEWFVNGSRTGYTFATSSSMQLGSAVNIPVVFAVNDSEQMRLTSTGLGIGTSSPASKLHVYTSSGTADVRIQSNTYASSFSLYAGATGANAFGIYDNNASAYRAIIDSSGNLGLGVTPSGSTLKMLQGPADFVIGTQANGLYLANSAYYNGGWKYASGSAPSRFTQDNGAFQWHTAPSGTAGNAISFTQAMTLDASSKLNVFYPTNAAFYAQIDSRDGNSHFGAIGASASVVFRTQDTERARIDSSGNLLVGTTSATWAPSGGGAIQFKGFTSHAGVAGAYQSNGFNIQWNGSAARLWVDTTDLGSITVSSDYRIKKNIEDQTAPALERVMRLRPVTYEIADYGDLYKADGVLREGFIAHEVQEVIPSGAEGHKDQEDRIQNLRVDAILSVAVKAIQEQQAIIQSLTARVAALEAA